MKLRMPRKQKRLRATAQRTTSFETDDGYGDEPGMKLSRAFFVVLVLHLVAVGGIFLFNSLKNTQGRSPGAADTPPPRTAEAVSRAAAKPSAVPGRSTRIHQMRRGESLPQIAAFYGVSVADIEQANGIKAGTTVPAGTEIRIPSKASLGPVPLDVRKLVETPRTPLPGASVDRAKRTSGGPHAPDLTPVKSSAVKALETMASRPAPAGSAASPPVAAASPTASVPLPPVSASLPSGEIGNDQRGDNPAAIAKRFGVNYDELLKVNSIDDPRRLQIGQRLLIPKSPR